MSAATLSGDSLTTVQRRFMAALPSIDSILRYQFRNWPAGRRAEAIANARAANWAAWHALARRGKDPLQIGVTGIAARCCRSTKAGRKVGNRNDGRGGLDVLDHRARRRHGLVILSLDRRDAAGRGGPSDVWREWLAEDNRVSPADEAAFRLDFTAWLESLPPRKREMAGLLAEGHGTSAVAHRLGVTLPAVSIARTWLERSWRRFQGEDERQDVAPVRRSVGRPRKPGPGVRVQGTARGRAVVRAVVAAP